MVLTKRIVRPRKYIRPWINVPDIQTYAPQCIIFKHSQEATCIIITWWQRLCFMSIESWCLVCWAIIFVYEAPIKSPESPSVFQVEERGITRRPMGQWLWNPSERHIQHSRLQWSSTSRSERRQLEQDHLLSPNRNSSNTRAIDGVWVIRRSDRSFKIYSIRQPNLDSD